MMKFLKKTCIYTMVGLMVGLNIQMPTAQAAMVGTEQIVQQQTGDQGREKIIAFLDRSEVQQQLQSFGVASTDAKARVANLSDSEVQMLAGKIDQLPAGGSAIGTIVGAAVFIFIVLLITDILGVTNVFSFVHPL
jgi:hypothetical protein